MKQYVGVIFDLDGTLTDTLGDLADATNAVLRDHGLPVWPEEAYRRMVGSGARKLIERALGDRATPALTDELLAAFISVYNANCLHRTRPYTGVMDCLEALQRRGTRLAVVTNKPEEQAHKVVQAFFGGKVFTHVLGGRTDRPKKPDPGAVLSVLNDWGMRPEEALYVGDSDVDIYTAHNAGMAGAGACWGFRGEEELRAAGADYLLDLPLDLLRE